MVPSSIASTVNNSDTVVCGANLDLKNLKPITFNSSDLEMLPFEAQKFIKTHQMKLLHLSQPYMF
jgi:hypothetical protein